MSPPLVKLAAGGAHWDVDCYGAGLLGMNCRDIEDLRE